MTVQPPRVGVWRKRRRGGGGGEDHGREGGRDGDRVCPSSQLL